MFCTEISLGIREQYYISDSVITLKTWVVQESEFQIIGNETIHGFTCPSADIQTKRYISKYDEWGNRSHSELIEHLAQEYLQKSAPERWNFAK